ncbi:hypothetical protein PENTCL1PPCAC_29360 [Pristionchus entomophagus]|uniref:Clc-like protein n=1 Tax=Pristionchus entomophagus TaxID=358040 RepID=A0AAV5UJM4_9BILA|nr:hypothetical protein PENTCL1PPCAC_29360 [Pristionchus entomophagus]
MPTRSKAAATTPLYYSRSLMGEESRRSHTCILVLSLILIVAGFGLSAGGLASPSWQVVDIREFRAQHHHGLWLDCTRPERHLASIDRSFASEQPLHCTYKFDYSASQVIDENIENIDLNSAAGESEHHQFFGWHKAVLIFMAFSLLFAALALCSGICAPCNGGCAVIYAILVAISLFMGLVGDAIFFFAAHRVDSRFVTGLVGTYEQRIGVAFYLHLGGSAILMFALIVSIIYSYQVLRRSDGRGGLPLRELAPLYGSRIRETVA